MSRLVETEAGSVAGMRVVTVTRFGGPEALVVGEAPDPVAGLGQVVVGVSVVDVLFLETQLRSGWGREYFDLEPPYVPGTGVAGQVISVGEGVDPGWVGRRVAAVTDGGGYAERVVIMAEDVVVVPDGLGLREAAALLQVGPAALSLIDAAEITPGDRVLVTAAAGGLGSLLVQLASSAGALGCRRRPRRAQAGPGQGVGCRRSGRLLRGRLARAGA